MDDKVMAVLESYHARMRDEEKTMRAPPATGDGDWRDKVLLAVGPDTGRLINILARSLEAPTILELGTSYGYSGIWLAEAARADRRPTDHHGTAGLQIRAARATWRARPASPITSTSGSATRCR